MFWKAEALCSDAVPEQIDNSVECVLVTPEYFGVAYLFQPPEQLLDRKSVV